MTDAATLACGRPIRLPKPGAGIARRLEAKAHAIGARLDHGAFELTLPSGARMRLGGGELATELHLHDWGAASALLAKGDVGWGEAYVAGLWDCPDIEALATLTLRNDHAFGDAIRPGLLRRAAYLATDRILRRNSRAGSARNIQAHYDVGDGFYRLWLDESMTYSSALFAEPGDDLATAQARKYRRLLDATAGAGARTLEIGCGWGGFAEAAADAGRDVTAITVSPRQHAYASRRLDGRADIRLSDYRDVGGRYDSIVSIEMIEAVGERYWPAYFDVLKRRLAPGGVAAIQAIVVEDAHFPVYRARSDFIRQHIFPGGMLPSPGAIQNAATRAGLKTRNVFRFGQDYARTLRIWLESFEAALPRIRALGYDEAFIRGWRYYLAICAACFAVGRTDVIHVELTHA